MAVSVQLTQRYSPGWWCHEWRNHSTSVHQRSLRLTNILHISWLSSWVTQSHDLVISQPFCLCSTENHPFWEETHDLIPPLTREMSQNCIECARFCCQSDCIAKVLTVGYSGRLLQMQHVEIGCSQSTTYKSVYQSESTDIAAYLSFLPIYLSSYLSSCQPTDLRSNQFVCLSV